MQIHVIGNIVFYIKEVAAHFSAEWSIWHICIKMFWYLRTFLTMLTAMLKLMFIYNQFMMLDNKSFRKCVCVFETTLTRSKINWRFVYLCIRSKDFVPISTISDYIHWAALTVWFFVFFITWMKSGMFENLLHSYFVLFNIHVLQAFSEI
jgi:hypothetical protein